MADPPSGAKGYAQSAMRKTVSAVSNAIPAKVSNIGGSFIQAEGKKAEDCPSRVLQSVVLQAVLVLVVLADFILACISTDLRAAGKRVPDGIVMASHGCLLAYIGEFCLLVAVRKWKVFSDGWAVLDFVAIITGILELIPHTTGDGVGGMVNVKLLRLLRVVRMLKLLRKIANVRELRRLLQMVTNCLRSLFWSIAFCFMVLTVWSLVAVEVLHPIVQELAEENEWPDCKHCADAFSSIMMSNLTLFQTIMASDEFGAIAIPVIIRYPATSIIFMGSFISIAYGVLNLVVALIVDTFAEQRQKDDKLVADDLDEAAEDDLEFLGNIFDEIDEDNDVLLSLDEIKKGARCNEDFRCRLRVLDLDEADLEQLFYMLDEDGSGSVDKNEFIGTLNRWKEDSRTAARFVKHNMQRALDQQDRIVAMLNMQYEYLVAASSPGLKSLDKDFALSRQESGRSQLDKEFTDEGNRENLNQVLHGDMAQQAPLTQENVHRVMIQEPVDEGSIEQPNRPSTDHQVLLKEVFCESPPKNELSGSRHGQESFDRRLHDFRLQLGCLVHDFEVKLMARRCPDVACFSV